MTTGRDAGGDAGAGAEAPAVFSTAAAAPLSGAAPFPEATLRSLGAVAAACILVGSAVFAYALHAALPFNPIRLPFEHAVDVRSWLPEGWAFFTRSPREEATFLLAPSPDGSWRPFGRTSYSDPSNAFGLDRRVRARAMEMGMLMPDIPETAWTPCTVDPGTCVRTAAVQTIQNLSPKPTICGDFGVARQKPVPWAWSRSSRNVVMPSRVARIHVKC